MNVSETVSFGTGKPVSSKTETPGVDFWWHPDKATSLKTGGKANAFKVEALVCKAGKSRAGDKPYIIEANFNQLDLESGSGNNTAIGIRKP